MTISGFESPIIAKAIGAVFEQVRIALVELSFFPLLRIPAIPTVGLHKHFTRMEVRVSVQLHEVVFPTELIASDRHTSYSPRGGLGESCGQHKTCSLCVKEATANFEDESQNRLRFWLVVDAGQYSRCARRLGCGLSTGHW